MELFSIVILSALICGFVAVPGFALSLAFFPRKEDLDMIERLGLSTVLGLTPVFLLYFLDKNLSVPITTTTTLASFFLVSALGLGIWKAREKK